MIGVDTLLAQLNVYTCAGKCAGVQYNAIMYMLTGVLAGTPVSSIVVNKIIITLVVTNQSSGCGELYQSSSSSISQMRAACGAACLRAVGRVGKQYIRQRVVP